MTLSIDQRLAMLPPRTSIPFSQLLATSHISEDALHCILDAGDLCAEKSKLIGFAVAFLHLRSLGVPVHDVIRMAKHQKRRINLAWSASRWKEEHDRLARVEALQSMAKDNVDYDLTRFEARLPAQFPGYLIRSKRRLGMEGFRQRHCVASYHEQIAKGSLAVAALFVAHQRWTVALKLVSEPAEGLQITQIRTRYNAVPPPHIRQQIYDILGIAPPDRPVALGGVEGRQHFYMENLRRLVPVLRDLNVEHVTVSFDGGGDSGAIHDISFVPDIARESIDAATVNLLATEHFFDDGQWRSLVTPSQVPVTTAIEALTYDYLEETGVDWHNDDGGFGELQINVRDHTVALDVNVRYTRSELEYSAEHDIDTGNEI